MLIEFFIYEIFEVIYDLSRSIVKIDSKNVIESLKFFLTLKKRQRKAPKVFFEKYQDLSEEEKKKMWEYGSERCKKLSL